MKFYSHSKKIDGNEIVGSKLLQDHISGVSAVAENHFCANLQFSYSTEVLKELSDLIVKFHDLGKYTSYFQNYLLQKEPIDSNLKQHARLGGYASYNFMMEEEKKALISLYLIFHHHGNLISLDDFAGKIDENARRVFEKQRNDLEGKIPQIESELGFNDLPYNLNFPDSSKVRKSCKVWVKKKADIEDYFLLNYLFSLLIEADKLDASDTSHYIRKSVDSDYVDKRFTKTNTKLSDVEELVGFSNNDLRNLCRAEVVNHLDSNNILNKRIFTLTAPTGIGKTMTALDFALKLKTKIRDNEKMEAQIIYALPFINIIEQALYEYEQTLPSDEIRILGHYQFGDVFGIHSDSDEESYQQKLMKMDTWQSDIVITSFVQFFETLISNRNKLLKKFNHFAGSIIILDEVQTLRLDHMPLLGSVLHYLSKYLNARIILMTATRPKIFELAEAEILSKEGETVDSLELLTDHEKIFSLYERTAVVPLLDSLQNESPNRSIEFGDKVFKEYWTPEKSCLTVCNTVNRSIEIHNVIVDLLKENGNSNPVYYLSTNILPFQRLKRIQNIKSDIENGFSPILIATQVVEAGVDLDFNMGFRDVGPVDSIIQVAGRINRSNSRYQQNEPLYIVDFGECQKIYGQLTYQQAKKALSSNSVINESGYLKLIEEYFDNISERSSFRESRKFFNSMKTLNYDSDNKVDCPVSSFKIIEQSDRYRSVFIEIDSYSQELRQKYIEKITGELSREEFDKNFKLEFQQRILSVPSYLTNELPQINEYEEDILVVDYDMLESYYNEETGFIRTVQSDEILML
jgi:CRISPR-associated endonuclease/helicase Cas3